MKVTTADMHLAKARQVQDMMDDLRPSLDNLAAHVTLSGLYDYYMNKAQTAPGNGNA